MVEQQVNLSPTVGKPAPHATCQLSDQIPSHSHG